MKKTFSTRMFKRGQLFALACVLTLATALMAGCSSGNAVGPEDSNISFGGQTTMVSDTTTTTVTNAKDNIKSSATTTTTKADDTADSKKSTATTKKTPTATRAAHNHTYTTKVVSPTCTKGGYTLYSCSCGHSYKRRVTDKMGHSYGDWVIKKESTVSSNGSKERKCSRCGYVHKQSIPKKQQQSAGGIDPRVTITTIGWSNDKSPLYELGKCRVVDKRNWGSRPAIEVYDGNCMRVTYYNKKNEKVTFVVEPVGNYLNAFTILKDGTYVSQLFGAYS